VSSQEITNELIKKFHNNQWYNLLKTFLIGDSLEDIIEELMYNVSENKRFTPSLKHVFRPFDVCHPKDLKVVLISNEPNPFLNIADGLPFSGNESANTQEVTRYLLEAVNKTVYAGEVKSTNPDLSRWAEQGVLMLNLALTTEINKPGKHFMLWETFISFLIDMLTYNYPDAVWIFFGIKSQQYIELLPDNAITFPISHPGKAASMKSKEWDSEDVFNMVNEALITKGKTPIIW
jgi:uracil-DNA glycosylase